LAENLLQSVSPPPIQEIATRLQRVALSSEQLRHATGGQLALPQVFLLPPSLGLLDSKGCARLATPGELDIQISIRHCTALLPGMSLHNYGSREPIADIYETEYYTHLLTKGQKVAQLISAQSITRSEAWIAYQSIFLPSLRYSLSSTSFTRQELASIQRSSTQIMLRE
jgi:hypothetical protein